MSALRASNERDHMRASMRFSPQMLQMLHAARREKHANLTRARVRERKGEVLQSTLHRRAQRPPHSVWRNLTPEQRRNQRLARGVSEVGFTGSIKRTMGFRSRDDVTWRMEDGFENDQPRLDQRERDIRAANERKRQIVASIMLARPAQ